MLSALTREPSPLYWNGHICCSGSEAEIVFHLGLTESDCAVGALNGDVISWCPESQCLLEKLTSEQLRNATGGRDTEEWEVGGGGGTIRGSFGPENQRSIICQGLENDYTMAALSPAVSHSLFSLLPLFFHAFVKAGCYMPVSLHYLNSPSKVFDQVV